MGMIKSFQNINRNKIPKHLQNLRWLHQHSQTASLPCFRILEDIIAERGVFNLISGQKKKKKGNFFFSSGHRCSCLETYLSVLCLLFFILRISQGKCSVQASRAFVLCVACVQRCAAGVSVLALLRPLPAIGLSLSSHSVTPSQAQICLGFWKRPADLAMIPHAILQRRKKSV